MTGNEPLRCVQHITFTTNYNTTTTFTLVEIQQIRDAWQAPCSMFNSVVNLWLFKVIPQLLAELRRYWQQCVCLFSESLFLYSEPALSCVWWTGRQTSAFTIIELIVFFLCYCPLFQKSPAKQKYTLKTRLRLVTNIRRCLADDIFRLKLLLWFTLRQF